MLKYFNNEIWTYFVKYPLANNHIRELARILGISAPKVKYLLKPLLKAGLLAVTLQGKNHIISANHDSEAFILNKKWTNIFLLLQSGIVEDLNRSQDVIILFGSYSRGEDIETSDIDIAINDAAGISSEKYEKMLNRRIELHEISPNIASSLQRGIFIKGYPHEAVQIFPTDQKSKKE